jgi:1-acyl-sn-glycerol-3-phosphate acyltransferase
MIAYRVLRAFGRLALRWFYRDVEVVGVERLPHRGPVLLASNHPNALVDALVIGCTLRRPVTLTAKATLLESPITRTLLRLAGVVPLRRASDDANRARGDEGEGRRDSTPAVDPGRNARAFQAVLDVLEAGGVVLLFPEGKSHSDPALAPLKTGLARIALMARDDRHLASLPIIPVGLTFERKWEPRSRVVMHVGAPIAVGPGLPNTADGVADLTRRVDAGLRAVTLNFESADDARRVLAVSTLLSEILDEFRPLRAPDAPLAERVQLTKQIAAVAAHLPRIGPELAQRVDRFLARLTTFEAAAREHAVSASDVQMSRRVAPGAWFAVRECMIAAAAGPLALWGRVNHWVPLRLARILAERTSRTPDEPAMRTIVGGLVLVLTFYAAQTAVVGWTLGWVVAVAYAVSLPLSATWDLRYADRLRRAAARIRTYLRFRRDPGLHERLLQELTWLRAEAVSLGAVLPSVEKPAPTDARDRAYSGA